MTERKLASIRKIDEIRAIDGADAIECAVVGGWTVVVKKGEFAAGDLAVYLEIDSWVPQALAPFLVKGREAREFNGVAGERLRTIRLRGQLSQGLLLPVASLPEGTPINQDQDVTQVLGIQKWEAPVPAQLAGQVKGNFPTGVPKTDQERVQNLKRELDRWVANAFEWEVTEKLDGSSCTFFMDADGELHVCSRNLDLKQDDTNSFWLVAVKYNVADRMKRAGLVNFAIQGELIGEGIQKNPYALKGQDFYVFDMYDVTKGRYLSGADRRNLAVQLNLRHVPVLDAGRVVNATVEELLQEAEGKSVLNANAEREGIVFKSTRDPNTSFKAISNRFLLKGGE